MNIKHESMEAKGRFYIQKNGDDIAHLSYSKAGNTGLIINHTEVDQKWREKGKGKALVEHVVNYARQKGLKVIPLCPFAKSVINKDQSLKDVLNNEI